MDKHKLTHKYWLHDLIKENQQISILEHNESYHVLHDHDFTELVIVEKGKGIHFTSDSRHIITAGDVLVIPKGVKHGYEGTEQFRITNIAFNLSLLDSLPQNFREIPGFQSLFLLSPLQRTRAINRKGFLTLDPEQISSVKQMTGRIIHEQRGRATGYQTVCALVLADLVIFLSRVASRHNLAVHTDKLAIVLAYMEKNYPHRISLEELSRLAKLSPRNFQQIFKDYLGVSPFQQLIKIRLNHAGKMLRDTNHSISEIADAVGFGDSAYFTRQFNKMFHMPPSQYRKNLQSSGAK